MTQGGWRREVMMKGSGEEGKWWWRGVVTKGSGEEGKWWRREVVTKGCGYDGKWWGREVVRKGSGDEGEVVKKGSDDEGEWWRREVVRKGSGGEGKWWRRGVVKKGSDDEGEWWRREVVRKGSGEEGKWWRREVVKKGSGEEGKWWWRGVVTKGSGEEGKWWRREVVTKGSGEEGKWWWRGVVTKGSGEEGKCGRREVMMKGSGDEGNWQLRRGVVHDVVRVPSGVLFWGRSRSIKPCVWEEAGAWNVVFFRVKWLQLAMKGTSCVRRAGAAAVGFSFFCRIIRAVASSCFVLVCVPSYNSAFWNLCLEIALEWLYDITRALFWWGSRSTKSCVFPCKVAVVGDERYLVCAAGAAADGLLFFCRIGTVASSCFGCACVCVVIGCFGICACKSHWNGCMMLQGLMSLGRKPEHETLCFFRVKWLQATMKGTSCVRRVRLRSVCLFFDAIITVRWLYAALCNVPVCVVIIACSW